MKFHKRMVLRILFVFEIFIFTGVYCFGSQGMRVVFALCRENDQIEHHIADVQQTVALLENDVHVWQENPFFKEKLAREQLQMARDGELVYLVN